ncbi:Nn.00g004160.m01.CDS01 [Neocucurbitaria sp. VM-36]
MRLPNRPITSIKPLPSIYTAFPANYDNTDSSNSAGINSGTRLLRQIEDGLEVVPFERDARSAPILSPDSEEKEVFVMSQKEVVLSEKPLPKLPRSRWQRMSTRQRVLALLGVQFVILLTVGLSLMAAGNNSASDRPSRVRATGDDSVSIDSIDKIRRGPFTIPIQLPQQQSSACLAKMNESVAWQCASDTEFQLNILPSPPDNTTTTMITLGAPPSNQSLYHGHQVPNIPPVELTALPNGDSSGAGPAYHFSTTYDRVVLLKEDDLTPVENAKAQPLTQHPSFRFGESLWHCVFNDTLLQGYIYINQSTMPDITNNETSVEESPGTTRLPKVPYVVKLVEQRVPNGKGPYCEKVKVQQDGSLSSGSGKIILDLSASASELEASKSELLRSAKFRDRQQTPTANHCRCQWLIQ